MPPPVAGDSSFSGTRGCTKIYSTYHLAIDLGTDIRPGREYTVDVNGTLLTLVP